MNQADFMIPKDKRLVLEKGHYYLLNLAEDFNVLTQAQKKLAQTTYEQTKTDIMTVKMQVQLNRAIENSQNHDKRKTATLKSEALQQEILLLAKQLTQLKSAVNVLQLSKRPTPQLTSLLKKPPNSKNQHDIIQQCVTHLERLIHITSNHPSVLAKNRLKELQELQRIQQPKLSANAPTPLRMRPPQHH